LNQQPKEIEMLNIRFLKANDGPLDTKSMIPIKNIAKARIEYANEVAALSEKARAYLDSMPWCKNILHGWLDHASGYIIGVFYFHLAPSRAGAPSFVWVIVGDLPPAYLDVELCPSGQEAVQGYICEMQEWVDRVLAGRPIDDTVIPVNVPPEKEWAESLQGRLNLLRESYPEGKGIEPSADK
jgi:hypothetical protein